MFSLYEVIKNYRGLGIHYATEHARKHKRPFNWLDTKQVCIGGRHFYPFAD